MARFVIRMELHEANWDDYVKLAKALAASGILDTIDASDGRRYRLSPAEYHYLGDKALESVLETCKAAANSTGRKYAAFVSEVSKCQWTGLAVV